MFTISTTFWLCVINVKVEIKALTLTFLKRSLKLRLKVASRHFLTPHHNLTPPILVLFCEKLMMGKTSLLDLTFSIHQTTWGRKSHEVRKPCVWRKSGVLCCVTVCVFSCLWENERCVSCCQPACQRQAAPVHSRGSSLQLGYIDDE